MPAPQGSDEAGPFGIHDTSDDGWDWYYYYKPSSTPTDKQLEFAGQCSRVADRIREMGKTETTERMMTKLKNTFSAILVQQHLGDIGPHANEILELEQNFYRTVVTPAHQRRVTQPVLLTGVVLVVAIIAAAVLNASEAAPLLGDAVNTPLVQTFLYVVAGVLLGRLTYYGLSYSEKVTSMDQYFSLSHETQSTKVTLFFDMVVGVVACLFFVTGIIIIAFGGNENAATGSVDASITTLMIKDNALLAVAFGVLVGVVKTEFLRKIREVAKGGLG